MQDGRLVFRMKDNVLSLHEQACYSFVPCMHPTCISCGRENCNLGELDQTLDSTIRFYCYECITTKWEPPVSIRQVAENRESPNYVNTLVWSAYMRRRRFSNEFLFWFGRKWSKFLIRDSYSNSLHDPAIKLYKQVASRARQAVDMFCLCMLRSRIYKDLRQFIVKMIWPNEIICWLEE